MAKKIEIRWHGRGGMGVKTAALLLGEAFIDEGRYAQAFPEYGPERRGAPVVAFTRISDKEIKGHYGIRSPDVVVVLDPTLIESPRVKEGITEKTKIIVNTSLPPDEIKKKLKINCDIRTIDASGISERIFGKNFPNTPMLGALMKVVDLLPFDRFISSIEKRLKAKFKGDLIKKNIEAIKKAYEEVK